MSTTTIERISRLFLQTHNFLTDLVAPLYSLATRSWIVADSQHVEIKPENKAFLVATDPKRQKIAAGAQLMPERALIQRKPERLLVNEGEVRIPILAGS